MASDQSSPSYLLNHTDLRSLYDQTNNENRGIIDLGLSLRVLQPPTYHHPPNTHDNNDYRDMVEWNQVPAPYEPSNTSHVVHPHRKPNNDVVNERNVFEKGKDRSDFVKVNMEGVLIGRKICVLDHSNYLSLANQLEDMFGTQLLCSLRLFESGSEFSLWYKDRDGQWRMAGDVPWKEFVESVTRIRIMFRDKMVSGQ